MPDQDATQTETIAETPADTTAVTTTEAVQEAPPESVAEMSAVPSVAELAAVMGRPELAPKAEPEAAPAPAEAETETISDEPAAEAGDAEKPAETEAEPPEAEAKPEDDIAAKLKSAEEARVKLETEIAELKKEREAKAATPEPVKMPDAPRAEFFGLDAQTLAEVRTAEKVLQWAQENPEGGEIIGDNNQPVVVSAAQVQAAAARSEATLAAARQAGRVNFANTKRVADEYVAQHYPNIADTKHPDHAAYGRIMALIPGLQNFPDANIWVGRMLLGYNVEQERIKQAQAAAAKPPVKEPIVPKAPAAATTPRAQTTRTKPNTDRRREYLADLKRRADAGDTAAMTQYFAETAA